MVSINGNSRCQDGQCSGGKRHSHCTAMWWNVAHVCCCGNSGIDVHCQMMPSLDSVPGKTFLPKVYWWMTVQVSFCLNSFHWALWLKWFWSLLDVFCGCLGVSGTSPSSFSSSSLPSLSLSFIPRSSLLPGKKVSSIPSSSTSRNSKTCCPRVLNPCRRFTYPNFVLLEECIEAFSFTALLALT